jgi:polygalacturonase
VIVLCASAAGAQDGRYDIRRFGAVAGQKELCTAAIQKAIDACAAAGGGTVYIPPGKFTSGTLALKSYVTLELEAGATLLGSTNPRDYPQRLPALRSYTDKYVCQALIYAENAERIGIRGRGTIDGQGAAFRWPEYRDRPYLIRFVSCRDVRVEGVHLRNSAMWMEHYLACERVTIDGITVWNHSTCNNDGIDIDACRDVTLRDSVFDSDDDAICLKSTLDRPCENVVISNCIARSHCNAIKMGTESNGGFQNVAITNCAVQSPRESKPVYGIPRGMAGIALEIVDGGRLDRVAISNITIRDVAVPIFLRLGNRARPFTKDGPKPAVGTFRNVTITGVVATGMSTMGCAIAGIPGHKIENVCLADLNLQFEGGGQAASGKPVPEQETKYPESRMFGTLPAYGFYCRHVQGITFSNVRLGLDKPDPRPALVTDDVSGLIVRGFDAVNGPER